MIKIFSNEQLQTLQEEPIEFFACGFDFELNKMHDRYYNLKVKLPFIGEFTPRFTTSNWDSMQQFLTFAYCPLDTVTKYPISGSFVRLFLFGNIYLLIQRINDDYWFLEIEPYYTVAFGTLEQITNCANFICRLRFKR